MSKPSDQRTMVIPSFKAGPGATECGTYNHAILLVADRRTGTGTRTGTGRTGTGNHGQGDRDMVHSWSGTGTGTRTGMISIYLYNA